ncbi:MAG TPA: uracil-DNA glycosylase family protein [Thermoanaerobaculia bacterium]|nr:uracil-DNA glycosylase family protein [Thermoanaerobaculia bacterium]
MLRAIADDLNADLEDLAFGPPVTHVYNPAVYAREPHAAFLERFGAAPKEVLLVGMNPGPWGMAQTGVPFGEVGVVRDWLGISGAVGRPDPEHPKRRVQGFGCTRSEVSGSRLWGWVRERFGAPERFFARFFLHNYCPLVFLEESGRNRTPDKLPAAEREPLFAACDRALVRTVEHLAPRWVVGIGAFAEARARQALAGRPVEIGRVLHPSPASPLANRDWGGQVDRALAELGIQATCRGPSDGSESSSGTSEVSRSSPPRQ